MQLKVRDRTTFPHNFDFTRLLIMQLKVRDRTTFPHNFDIYTLKGEVSPCAAQPLLTQHGNIA